MSTTTTHTTPQNTTGAELQTLREAAGLTRDALGELASVAPRTVKHWETRAGAGVPADVAALVQSAAHWVRQTAAQSLQQAQSAPAGAGVVLLRYRETAHLPRADQVQGLRADIYGAMVARVALELLGSERAPRVVWFDPQAFAHWVQQVQGLPPGHDTPQARAQWAAQAIQAQALPHPGDQPPAHAGDQPPHHPAGHTPPT